MKSETAKRGLRREFFATRPSKRKKDWSDIWYEQREAAFKNLLTAFKKQTD